MRALVLSQCEQKGYAFFETYERYIFNNTNVLFRLKTSVAFQSQMADVLVGKQLFTL